MITFPIDPRSGISIMPVQSINRICMKTFAALLISLTAFATFAAEPAGFLVCVSNERSDDVTIIDGASQQVLATIPVGKRPRGIHASPDGKNLFVAVSGSPISGPRHQGASAPVLDDDEKAKPDRSKDGIGVVDLAAKKFVRKIPAGSDPEQFAVSPDGAKLYIANEDAGAVSVLDTKSGRVENQIPVAEEPEGVVFAPDGKTVYATCETAGDVFVIDTALNKSLAHFIVGGRPRNVAFTPDGSRAFIPSESTGVLHVIDTSKRMPVGQIQLATNSRPMCVVMARDGKYLYASTGWGASIAVVDVTSGKVVNTIQVGPRPWGFALSPDGKQLFVANGPSNDISVVDLATAKEIARIKAGSSPWGVEVVPISK
jgi:YVTN family beta-propeller protein